MSELSVKTTELHGLLDRVDAGDSGALNTLIQRVSTRLKRLVGKMIQRFPRVARWAEPDDVLQNSSMRLVRALEQQIRPESMRAFYALASTQIRRELLDMTKSLYGPHGDGTHYVSVNISPDDSDKRRKFEPSTNNDDQELDRWFRFHQEVEKLPTEEREVVGLIFYHRMKQNEVAEIFDVHPRTIQRWWTSALKKLQDVLSDWAVDE